MKAIASALAGHVLAPDLLEVMMASQALRRSFIALHMTLGFVIVFESAQGLGGFALVAIFLVALLAHALRGEFPANLLVYAAVALFVTLHGSAWRPSHSQAAA